MLFFIEDGKTRKLHMVFHMLWALAAASSIVNAQNEDNPQGRTEPQLFLSTILTRDLDGDSSFRVGKVIYTDGRRTLGDCDCSTPRELFYIHYDPIVIVRNWNILKTQILDSGDATVLVHFRALAQTEGQGDASHKENQRRIKPLSAPRDEDVAYHLHFKDHEWFLVDPPLPRVGLDTLLTQTRSAINHMEKKITLQPENDPRASYRRAEFERLKGQLAALESLPMH